MSVRAFLYYCLVVVILATFVPVQGHLPCQHVQSCFDTETTIAFGYEVTSGSWRRANAHLHQKSTSYYIGLTSAAVIHSASFSLLMVLAGQTLWGCMRLSGGSRWMIGTLFFICILPTVVSEVQDMQSRPDMQADDSQLSHPPFVFTSASFFPSASGVALMQTSSGSAKARYI